MKNSKRFLALSLLLAMLLTLCACGSGSKVAMTEAAAPAEAPAAMEEMGYAMDSSANGLAMAGGTAVEDGGSAAAENPEKIIYSANVTVETTAFEESLEQLNALVEQYGAWVESSSVSGADYYSISRGRSGSRSASYTLRVPSDRFDTLMNSLSTLGNIPYTHTYTENVTAQYYDAQARLTAYTTQETRLLEMMELAETVSDVIAIEEKLTELRYQIERIQTSLNNWDRQVDYSYVYLDMQEVKEYTPEAKESYGQKLGRAFTGGFQDAAEFFQNLLLWLVGSLPLLMALAVALVIALPLLKKRRAKRKMKKDEE